jgi:glycosyltransferase involved in cell wall biosynthesis
MESKYSLTVIIPTYNTEEYLKRCIESVLNQSLKEIKLLVVNDASTDKTLSILSEFKDNCRVEIITNSHNLGQGESRNIGIEMINTEYFCFLDSDDWVDTLTYEAGVKALTYNKDCDIAIFGVKTEHENSTSSTIRYNYTNNIISGEFGVTLLSREVAQDSPISALVGNKIFRTSSFDKRIKFSNLFFEDTSFSYKVLLNSKSIILLADNYLHYYQREHSIMHTFSEKYIDDLIENFTELKEYLVEKNMFKPTQYYSYFDKCCSSMLECMFSSTQIVKEQKGYIKYLVKQIMLKMDIENLIEYIDINRIRKLLYKI